MNNLVLGYGRLGQEIVSQTGWDYISRGKDNFDFCDINSYSNKLENYDIIINCIANTDTYGCNKKDILKVNFDAVCDLVDYCNIHNKKLVHISSDFVYSGSDHLANEEKSVPVHAKTWYSYSKLLADGYIESRGKNYLTIRTSFKPFPFPYSKAITTLIGNFDYTNVIANLIIKLIKANASGLYNLGTEVKTVYNLAIRSNPNVLSSDDSLNENMPKDVTMDLSKMKSIIGEN